MTTYVERPDVPDEGTARVWTFGGKTRSVQQDGELEKSSEGFGHDKKLARTCLQLWKEREYSGNPSGPASFFHQEFHTPHVCWSTNRMFQGYFHGGWMQALEKGHVEGPLYLYDINSAYWWAASCGLPHELRRYRPGDKRFVAVMDIRGSPTHVPPYFRGGRRLVTHEDVRLYDLAGEILCGVSWDASDERTEAARHVGLWRDELPRPAWKLLSRSYWGRWASLERTKQHIYVDGEKKSTSELKNPFLHLPWATLIVHRVIGKVYRETLIDAVNVCVDSVIRSEPMETGEKPGEWSLEEEIGEHGIWIHSSGRWTRVPVDRDPREWDRHAGIGPETPVRRFEDMKERHGPSMARTMLNMREKMMEESAPGS